MRKIILGAFVLAATASLARQSGIFAVLKSSVAIGKQPGGVFLLPPNQLLRPWGEQTVIPGRPVDMTYDSQKRILAVLNTRNILLLDGSTGTKVAEIATRSTSYAGIAFRPGDRELPGLRNHVDLVRREAGVCERVDQRVAIRSVGGGDVTVERGVV